MRRLTYAAKINEGQVNALRQTIGAEWQEITAFLDAQGISNFSIWNAADLLFIYGEAADDFALNENGKNELSQIVAAFKDIITWISAPGEEMRLMYQNFGYVRESKELVRIRMFMTKLKEGCADEYQRRHQVLIDARNGKLDPGPDSNFGIWSAGGYIFGYNEIDITMEKAETPEEHENTVAWETRQLGIMDWITDDVDWLTGEHHVKSICLGHHI